MQAPPNFDHEHQHNVKQDILLYTGYYLTLGFNLALINPNYLQNRDYLNPYKSSATLIGSLKDPKFANYHPDIVGKKISKVYGEHLNGATGIGVYLGFSQITALDFDNCNDLSVIDEVLIELDLPSDYPWVTITGSRKGFHILFYTDFKFIKNRYDSILALRANYKFIHRFTHLELREVGFLVLPPSIHESGNTYTFRNGIIPTGPPKTINEYYLRRALGRMCSQNYKVDHISDFDNIGQNENFITEFSSEALEINNSSVVSKVPKKIHNYVIIDTETTGLPIDFDKPISDVDNWPRLIQLAWLIFDHDGNVLTSQVRTVKPDFMIPEESVRIHGIDNQTALNKGVDIFYVLDEFSECIKPMDIIVGHNIEFDIKVLGAEFIRTIDKNILSDNKLICTMKMAEEQFNMDKYPKLSELYYYIFKKDMDNQHNALSDAKCTAEIFFKMLKNKDS